MKGAQLTAAMCARMGSSWVARDPMSGLLLFKNLQTTCSETLRKEWKMLTMAQDTS